MILYELVGLQLRLDSIVDFSSAEEGITNIIDSVENLAFQVDDPYKEKLLKLADIYRSAVNLLKSSENTVDLINNQIDQEIIEKSQQFFAPDYQKELEYNNPENIRKTRQ